MMKTKVVYLIFIIFFVSCSKKDNIVAIAEGIEISLDSVDITISKQIFKLRNKIIDMEIAKILIKKEADKNNLSIKELIQKQIKNKSKNISLLDIEKYVLDQNITDADTSNIISYLTTYYEKERQDEFVDSLKYIYQINIFIK